MADLLNFSIDLALQTGKLLLSYFNQAGIHASRKKDQTVVTEADTAADRLITKLILDQNEQHEIISEESSHLYYNPGSSVWVIDPLDGTTNFSLGLPIWGISIAYLVNGFPEFAVAYFPLINELYTAMRGKGAYLNNIMINTRAPDPSQPMSFFACCSRSFRQYEISIPYKPRIMGSGVYNFCLVARGSALLGLDAAPKIWDLAAAWLLVEEAQGKIEAFEGQPPFPISPELDYSSVNFPTLAAATPEIFCFGQRKIHRLDKFH
jgi:myo-inositol-1(or 4)-monophosphatase